MKGLLMIEPLYHATVAGNKTQTRRSGGLENVNKMPDAWHYTGLSPMGKHTFEVLPCTKNGFASAIRYAKPRYKVDEVFYLKEPIFIEYDTLYTDSKLILYKFDNKHHRISKWSNKLFMPASAARAFVRISGIKCERLLDISDEDCIAEGIRSMPPFVNKYLIYSSLKSGKLDKLRFTADVKESFISLYKFANKMKPSAEIPNLWVWVYTFEYLKGYKL